MIVEHAILNIKKGRAREFEETMGRVHQIIESVPGFQRMEIRPCVETKDRYLLLVWWKSLEAHTHGFRGSPGYQEWREALHPFYEPFPVVQHYGAPIEYGAKAHS